MTQKLVDHVSLPGEPVCSGFTGAFPKASDCLVERRKSQGVVGSSRSASGQECVDAGWMALETGFVQGGIAIAVYRIDSCTLFQEQDDEGEIALSRCRNQGGGTPLVSAFDVCASIEKDLNSRRGSFRQRFMNRVLRGWLGAGECCSPVGWPCLTERQASKREE